MPRGTLELVNAHGTELADAVDRALGATSAVDASLRTAYGRVDLPFAGEAAREQWRSRLDVEEVYKQRHAALMRAAIARDGRLPTVQPDPVQIWRFGSPAVARGTSARNSGISPPPAEAPSGLTLVALGGEVVVDYALRLTREYPERRMWVAGYSNDVFGYVPSVRVLREGGYEGGDAMIYYGRPGPFTEAVEPLIVGEVRRLVGARR
jgi:hypothetical protein